MARELLEQRRPSETFDFVHINPDGRATEYQATIGFYADGRPGEVFLGYYKSGLHKASTDQDINARDSAILISFALQHGATPGQIASAMSRGEKGEPHGVLGTLLDEMVRRYEPTLVSGGAHV